MIGLLELRLKKKEGYIKTKMNGVHFARITGICPVCKCGRGSKKHKQSRCDIVIAKRFKKENEEK